MLCYALKLKMKDEQRNREELMKRRNTMRREIEKQYGKNSRPFRRRMAILREEADKIRKEYKANYEKKLKHLRKKYNRGGEKQEADRKTPEELKEYANMKIFNKGHFEEIKINKEEILVISKDIKLTEDEKAVLRLHNKFSIIQYLDEKEQV